MYLNIIFYVYRDRDRAPLVEREAHNLEVQGSIPCIAQVNFFSMIEKKVVNWFERNDDTRISAVKYNSFTFSEKRIFLFY